MISFLSFFAPSNFFVPVFRATKSNERYFEGKTKKQNRQIDKGYR
jgi:hypothetical protein